jgi:preprotein translocase subunit YajC
MSFWKALIRRNNDIGSDSPRPITPHSPLFFFFAFLFISARRPKKKKKKKKKEKKKRVTRA